MRLVIFGVSNLLSTILDCAIASGFTPTHKLMIGERALIAAGAVVIDDVPERAVVAGVPAAVKKTMSS